MQSGYGAYEKVAKHTEAPRQVEYRLLGQVNAALQDGAQSQPDRRKMVEALLWNKQVWDHFMMDLLDQSNNLPKPTRASLTQLGIWMNKEVSKELTAAETDPTAIIEINQMIMKGLAGISPDGSNPKEEAARAANAGTSGSAPSGPMGAGNGQNVPGAGPTNGALGGGNTGSQRPSGPYSNKPPSGYKPFSSDA